MPSVVPFVRQFPIVAVFVCAALTLAGFRLAAVGADEQSQPSVQQRVAEVTIVLRDQRVLQGHVDARTNDEVLWVRVQRNAVSLATGFTWDLVERIETAEGPYTAAEFQPIAYYFASAQPSLRSIARPPSSRRVLRPVISVVPDGRIQSLEVFGEIGNWDRDAEIDGVLLRVLPLDAEGRVLPIDGVVSVQLIGRRMNGSGRQDFETLGQWSQRVRSVDFRGYEGAVYRLALGVDIDKDWQYQSFGVLKVAFNGRGQGTFEAESPVRLRRPSPFER